MTELTATLVINRSESYCGNCRKPTLPNRIYHDNISGWNPKPGGGCGARFVETSSDYPSISPDSLRRLRPDLPVKAAFEALRADGKPDLVTVKCLFQTQAWSCRTYPECSCGDTTQEATDDSPQ